MSAADAVTVTCSWVSNTTGVLPWLHTVVDDEAGGGLAAAEALMNRSLGGSCGPGFEPTTIADGSTAPWLQLQCNMSSALALCLSSNARVVEVHQVDDAGGVAFTAPLLTVEGTEAAPGVYSHFLLNDGVAPLLPAGVLYRIKLFARRPRSVVQVRCCCLVLQSLSSTNGGAAAPHLRQAPVAPPTLRGGEAQMGCDGPPHELPPLPTVQSALEHLSRRMDQMAARMDGIDSRLAAVEARLAQVPSTLAAVASPAGADV